MAGNAKPGDQDRPQEAEVVESTVAMESPGVTAGVPLPISNPPPALAGQGAAENEAPDAAPAPSPNPPGAAARSPLGRPLGPPGIPSSTRNPVANAGRVALPSAGATGAKPPGAPLGPPGMSAKRTVMGIAPPANMTAGGKPGGASPLAPAPAKSPGLPLRPPGPAAGPAAPTPMGAHGVPKLHSDEDEPPDDAPTVASDLGAFVATAGLDPAREKLPPQRPAAEKEDKKEENDAATVTVPKDVLDRVRADPKAFLAESKAKAPVPAAGRPYSDIDDSAEPTKAVSRDELLGRTGPNAGGGQEGHVVIGADAGGEDATLAVAPGSHEASSMNLGAAIGNALASGSIQSPLGSDPAFPPPHAHQQAQPQGHPYQSYQGMGPPSGQNAPNAGQGPPPHEWGMQGHPQNQPWSSAHMPATNPRTQGGAPSYGGGANMQGMQQPQGGPGGIPRAHAPTNWNPLQAPAQRDKSKISGQMILLFVVGFVCLAIFVTGIVLFATTKF